MMHHSQTRTAVSPLAPIQVLIVLPALIRNTSNAPSLVSVSILTWSVTVILSAQGEKMRILIDATQNMSKGILLNPLHLTDVQVCFMKNMILKSLQHLAMERKNVLIILTSRAVKAILQHL